MLGIKSNRFRLLSLFVVLVAALALSALLLARQGNVQCADGGLVNSVDECQQTQGDGNSRMGEGGNGNRETQADVDREKGTDSLAAAYWPSRWGDDDEAGASNWITAAKILAATDLIEAGKIYELGRQYTHGMPLFGNRTYSLTIPGAPTGGPFPGGMIYHDEFVVGEIGQVGTQLDGLGHVGYIHNGVERFYNGLTEEEIMGGYGLKKLGVESVRPIFTRGILIDIVGYKGEMLDAGTVITLEDVKGALKAQEMSEDDILDGDVVLFHTGWGDLWGVDDDRYNSGAPGIGIEVGKWLSGQNITMVGSDTWPVEVVPSVDPNDAFPVHKHLLTEHGILIHENLNLGSLASDEVYEFAYIFVRVPFKGGTGSPGSPIAVK